MDTIGSSPADFIRGGISMTFDLERARGLRDFLQDDCAEVGDVWGEMIAEIERLRPFEIAARDLDSDLGKIAGERDEQSARIKELEEAKLRSWQITEERKAALAAMSNLSETISCPDCGVWIGFADIGPHMAVLRAMLREAE